MFPPTPTEAADSDTAIKIAAERFNGSSRPLADGETIILSLNGSDALHVFRVKPRLPEIERVEL